MRQKCSQLSLQARLCVTLFQLGAGLFGGVFFGFGSVGRSDVNVRQDGQDTDGSMLTKCVGGER